MGLKKMNRFIFVTLTLLFLSGCCKDHKIVVELIIIDLDGEVLEIKLIDDEGIKIQPF